MALNQSAYRWRNDDGGETTATWVAAVNTAPTAGSLPLDTNIRLRIEIEETASVNESPAPTLQYRLNGGPWWTLSGAALVAAMSASPNLADGTNTTEQLTGAGTSSRAFQAGEFEEVTANTAAISNLNNEQSEFEWCFQLKAAALFDGDVIEFRATDFTVAFAAYAQIPAYTVVIADSVVAFPGTAVNTNTGATAWTNPGNATALDGTPAVWTAATGTETGDALDCDNFGFVIPNGATIVGIRVRTLVYEGASTDNVTENTIQLIKEGTPTGDNKASATEWPTESNARERVYGGVADLWGTTWTEANIEHADHGVRLIPAAASGTTPVGNVDYVEMSVHYEEAAGEEFTISPVGTLTTAGQLRLVTRKTFVAGLATAGAFEKDIDKALTGALASSGVLVKAVDKSLAGTLTTAGTLTPINRMPRTYEGSLATSGALAKSVDKSLAGALTTAGALSKTARLLRGGTLSTEGDLGSIRTVHIALGGVLATADQFRKLVHLVRGGAAGFAGALGLGDDGDAFFVSLGGSLATAGSVSRRVTKTVAGSLAPAGTMAKAVDRSLAGSLATTGSISKTNSRRLAGSLSTTGAFAKRATKRHTGTLSPSGSLSLRRTVPRTFTGSLGTAGAFSKKTTKRLQATLPTSSSMAKFITKRMVSTLSTSGAASFIRPLTLYLTGTLATVGTLVARLFVNSQIPPYVPGAPYPPIPRTNLWGIWRDKISRRRDEE